MSQHLGLTPTAGRLPAGPGVARGSVCLITPPSSFLLDERVFVSLGILKVAASLEARNYPVNFLATAPSAPTLPSASPPPRCNCRR